MPFGLCNALATFERLIDRILQGLQWSCCLVYLDYIISFGSTFGDALDNLTLIFERLRAYVLQLKSTKCHLFQSSVPFLVHIVGRRGLECDSKKIEDVKSWPVSSLVLSVITEDLYLILLTSRPPGGLDWQRRLVCVGTSLFNLVLQSVRFSHSRPDTGLSYGDRTVHLGHRRQ